jgi:hypothetical protein
MTERALIIVSANEATGRKACAEIARAIGIAGSDLEKRVGFASEIPAEKSSSLILVVRPDLPSAAEAMNCFDQGATGFLVEGFRAEEVSDLLREGIARRLEQA